MKTRTVKVTKKHLAAAIKAVIKHPRDHCSHCVMAKAVGYEYGYYTYHTKSGAEWRTVKKDGSKVRKIVDLFDDGEYKKLERMLPVTVTFVKVE